MGPHVLQGFRPHGEWTIVVGQHLLARLAGILAGSGPDGGPTSADEPCTEAIAALAQTVGAEVGILLEALTNGSR